MVKNQGWKSKLADAFKSKVLWKRIIITLLVLIFGAFLVMSDQYCNVDKGKGQVSCGTKSHVEIKK